MPQAFKHFGENGVPDAGKLRETMFRGGRVGGFSVGLGEQIGAGGGVGTQYGVGGGACFSVRSFYRYGKRSSERPVELPKDTQQANSTARVGAQVGCPVSTMSTNRVSQI